MFYRTAYISTARGPITSDVLRDILTVSRRNNGKAQITGMLIAHQGRFFQVLEGTRMNVLLCYKRIAQDQRHRETSIVLSEDVSNRAFPKWRMGYSDPAELGSFAKEAIFSIYDLMPPNSPDRGEDPEVRNQVRRFLAQFETLRAS